MLKRPITCRSFRGVVKYLAWKLVLCSAAVTWLSLPASGVAQSFSFNLLSTNATWQPATDGVSVVTIDPAGDIVVIPFAGGPATTLVPAAAALPNGLGAATSFTAFGVPDLINSVVYFGAESSTGSGYYSIPLAGGAIQVIVDSTMQDSSGDTVNAATLPQELYYSPYLNYGGLPIPGIQSNLFVSAAGGATFVANLTSAAAPQGDLAILNLSSSGTLSSVIDSNSLSGCVRIGSFATDGNIFAVWAISDSGELLLLENSGPALSCSDVLLNLGTPETNATGTLPGQPASGSIMEQYVAPSTVIDSGYIYFTASMTLTSTTSNGGIYSGVFRIQPGGSIEKVIATDNPALAYASSTYNIDSGPPSMFFCSSFAVRGSNVVFATGEETHYGFGNGLIPYGFFFYNQSTAALSSIASVFDALSPSAFFSDYDGGAYPTEAGLSADGKFAFQVRTQNASDIPTFDGLYTVNLVAVGSTTTLSAAPNPVTYGTPVVLTATVTSSGSSSPTGQIAFADGTTALGSARVNSAGAATLTTNLSGGSHSLTATYGGDSATAASTGLLTLLINPATPALSVSSSASSVTAVQPVMLTATAAGITGATGPTGGVTFDNGTTMLGASSLSATGVATLSVPGLPVGANSITASYTGDANYTSANSSATIVNVSAVSTVTVLSASLATATVGTAVTLTALVTASQGTPSGTVNFTSNGVAIGSGAISSGGSATLAANNLPAGANSIQAVFAGSAFFPRSTSNNVSVTITGPPSFSISSSSTNLTIQQGQTGTATISLHPAGGFSTAVQFSCSGLPENATCSFSPQSITPGASIATTTLTIATNVQTSELAWPTGVSYAGLVLLGIGGLCGTRRRIQRISAGFFLLFTALTLSVVMGCGSSSNKGPVTPPGVSTVTVTGTSGSSVQTVNLTVTISSD